MLKFHFTTSGDPSAKSAGLCQESICVHGENTQVSFDHLMVVLSAAFLLDQVVTWLEKGTRYLTYGFIDRGEDIEFERIKTTIFLKASSLWHNAKREVLIGQIAASTADCVGAPKIACSEVRIASRRR